MKKDREEREKEVKKKKKLNIRSRIFAEAPTLDTIDSRWSEQLQRALCSTCTTQRSLRCAGARARAVLYEAIPRSRPFVVYCDRIQPVFNLLLLPRRALCLYYAFSLRDVPPRC